jgi:hypothetical protein
MTTIYLDHNIIHYYVRGFPQNDDHRASSERSALVTVLKQYPNIRFVVSAWNIMESASEREPGAPAEELAERYADFYEQLMPLHIPAPDVVEREEMKHCVYGVLGLIPRPPEIPVFSQYLSQVLTLSGIEPLVAYDLRKELRYFARKRERREVVEDAKRVAFKAREEMLNAKKQGRDKDPQVERQILRAWFARFIPLRGPDGRVLPAPDRERVLNLFTDSPGQVFISSPAIWAENALTEARANMGSRKPRLQDGMDLMHAIVPLAYCDAFVSNDGNVRDCARRVLKVTDRAVVVASRLSETLDGLPRITAA